MDEKKKLFDIEIIIVLSLCVTILTRSSYMLNKLSKLINKLKFKNTILKDDKYLNREINSDSSKSESTK
jgi:hypothetical protein